MYLLAPIHPGREVILSNGIPAARRSPAERLKGKERKSHDGQPLANDPTSLAHPAASAKQSALHLFSERRVSRSEAKNSPPFPTVGTLFELVQMCGGDSAVGCPRPGKTPSAQGCGALGGTDSPKASTADAENRAIRKASVSGGWIGGGGQCFR